MHEGQCTGHHGSLAKLCLEKSLRLSRANLQRSVSKRVLMKRASAKRGCRECQLEVTTGILEPMVTSFVICATGTTRQQLVSGCRAASARSVCGNRLTESGAGRCCTQVICPVTNSTLASCTRISAGNCGYDIADFGIQAKLSTQYKTI